MTSEIVVARYNENIDWLKPLLHHATIYNKGDSNTVTSIAWMQYGARVAYLPNVGREAQTYIWHIVNNYDRLSEWTTFTQGNPFDHERAPLTLSKRCQNGMSSNCSLANNSQTWHPSESFNIKQYRGKLLEPYEGTFKQFWDKYVRVPFPKNNRFFVYWGAIFCVSKERILSRPRSDYVSMLLSLDSPNPEAAHFFERAWYYIFD